MDFPDEQIESIFLVKKNSTDKQNIKQYNTKCKILKEHYWLANYKSEQESLPKWSNRIFYQKFCFCINPCLIQPVYTHTRFLHCVCATELPFPWKFKTSTFTLYPTSAKTLSLSLTYTLNRNHSLPLAHTHTNTIYLTLSLTHRNQYSYLARA